MKNIKNFNDFLNESLEGVVYLKCNSHRSSDKLYKTLGEENVKVYVSFHSSEIYEIPIEKKEELSKIKGITFLKQKPDIRSEKNPNGEFFIPRKANK